MAVSDLAYHLWRGKKKILLVDYSLGARRLLTYQKLPEGEVSSDSKIATATDNPNGVTANELNEFRRKVCVKVPNNFSWCTD